MIYIKLFGVFKIGLFSIGGGLAHHFSGDCMEIWLDNIQDLLDMIAIRISRTYRYKYCHFVGYKTAGALVG